MNKDSRIIFLFDTILNMRLFFIRSSNNFSKIRWVYWNLILKLDVNTSMNVFSKHLIKLTLQFRNTFSITFFMATLKKNLYDYH